MHISLKVQRKKLHLLSPCRLVSLGESLQSYDVFKIDIDISTCDRYHLWIIESYGVYNIMIRQKKDEYGIVIDCTGPDGNAFYLLRLAQNLAKKLCWSNKEISNLLTEMKESDYDHLVKTFDKHFGWYVTLEF